MGCLSRGFYHLVLMDFIQLVAGKADEAKDH
jgi:hypothetical protein